MSKSSYRNFDRTASDLADASILITGGTGSFDRAFVRKVLSGTPASV